MTLLPLVIMAGEQEVNQHSIISQSAPGGKGASHVGTHASPGTPHTTGAIIPMGYSHSAGSLRQDALLTLPWPAIGWPPCLWCKHKRRKKNILSVFAAYATYLFPISAIKAIFWRSSPVWTGGVKLSRPGRGFFLYTQDLQTKQNSIWRTHFHLNVCWQSHTRRDAHSEKLERDCFGSRSVLVPALPNSLRTWQMFLLKSELRPVAGNH